MAINFTYEQDGEILKVTTSGKDDSLEEVESYAKEILGLAIENNTKMVLCDERNLEYSLSVIDTFRLAETASKVARILRKIVIVCNQKYLKDGNFFETVSQNRGLTVCVTTDYNQALELLDN